MSPAGKKGVIIILIILITAALVLVGAFLFVVLHDRNFNDVGKYVVLISVDSLNKSHFNAVKDLPNIKYLIENGSYSCEMKSVYPSQTYPAHVSMMTGVYPGRHGVYNNEICEVGEREQEWHWYDRDIGSKTIHSVLEKRGMKVASILMPGTAGANISFNCPEIKPMDGQNLYLLFLKYGSPLFLAQTGLKYGGTLNKDDWESLDDFTAKCAAYAVTKKPSLVMAHLLETDHVGHRTGSASPETINTLKKMDSRVGRIIKAVKDNGIFDKTVFIVAGDHGMVDAPMDIRLNVAFRQEGWITVNDKGNITDWKVYSNRAGGSAQVYLKNGEDENLREKVEKLLGNLLKDERRAITYFMTEREASENKALSGDFAFVLEASPGYKFINDWIGDEIFTPAEPDFSGETVIADHGFDPDNPGLSNYSSLIIVSGPGIKKGVDMGAVNIVDIAPTAAKILGVPFDDIDGRALDEIFE